MSFFNEFPNTRTYDSDLAWLIKRMKEILTRMDSVEERMAALENLVRNFLETLNVDDIIREYIEGMIDSGRFDELLLSLMTYYNRFKILWTDSTHNLEQLDSALNHRLLLPNGATHMFTAGQYCQAMMSGGNIYINISSFDITGLPVSSDFTVTIENTNREYMISHFGAYVPEFPKNVGLKYLTRRSDSQVIYICKCYCDSEGIRLDMRTSAETPFRVSELPTLILPVVQTDTRVGLTS